MRIESENSNNRLNFYGGSSYKKLLDSKKTDCRLTVACKTVDSYKTWLERTECIGNGIFKIHRVARDSGISSKKIVAISPKVAATLSPENTRKVWFCTRKQANGRFEVEAKFKLRIPLAAHSTRANISSDLIDPTGPHSVRILQTPHIVPGVQKSNELTFKIILLNFAPWNPSWF